MVDLEAMSNAPAEGDDALDRTPLLSQLAEEDSVQVLAQTPPSDPNV